MSMADWQGVREKIAPTETWLPRFTAEDFVRFEGSCGIRGFGITLSPDQCSSLVNKRLEEFEKSCAVMIGNGRTNSNWLEGGIGMFEALMLPPRKIERGVSKAEIAEVVTTRKYNDWKDEADHLRRLIGRIEREGIVE